jgi:hypothetical protein
MRVYVLKRSYEVKYFEMKNASLHCAISGFRREADWNCALVGYYAKSSGNSLPMFRDDLSFPSSRAKNPNFSKELPLLAA